jgi:SAM-dependent methyltransferase
MYTPADLASGLGRLAHAYLACDRAAMAAGIPLQTPFNNTGQQEWIEAIRLWNAHGHHLVEAMPTRACPACGQSARRELFTSFDGYPYCECVHCGCWYVPLQVEAKVFEDFFDACPAAKALSNTTFEQRQTMEFEASNLERIGGYLDHLLPLFPPSDRGIHYLDVGCGLGHSLKAASLRGMTAVGTESSVECLAIAHKNGLDVRPASESLIGQTFDLISFWESLEHIADPVAVLKDCAQMLNEDGLLAFTVPNQNSPPIRVQRADCYVVHGGYDTPGHINLFNPHTLGLLMSRAGFSLLYVDGQYGMNAGELAAYLAGRHRGARDLLATVGTELQQTGLTQLDNVILQGIGPAISVLERVLLASPILYCIACKAGAEARFAQAIEAAGARRKTELLAQSAILNIGESRALDDANARIAILEQELALARIGPFRRLVRYLRGTF